MRIIGLDYKQRLWVWFSDGMGLIGDHMLQLRKYANKLDRLRCRLINNIEYDVKRCTGCPGITNNTEGERAVATNELIRA